MAESPGWGPGWPSCPAKSRLVTVKAPISGTRFSFDFRIAELWVLLLSAMEHGGYLCDPSQCGSWNCRPIKDTQKSSSHAIGTTGDINWRRNPMRRPLMEDIPKWVRDMFARYGFNLGRDFRPTPDPMHFSPKLNPDGMLQMLHKARIELGGQRDKEEDDDMAGAFPLDLPAAATDDPGAPFAGFGHLEVIPIPPSNGAGAARDGAKVWLQLACGHLPVTVHQLGFRGGVWRDEEPFELRAGEPRGFNCPPGTRSAEIRYSSLLAFSALVEWRKL